MTVPPISIAAAVNTWIPEYLMLKPNLYSHIFRIRNSSRFECRRLFLFGVIERGEIFFFRGRSRLPRHIPQSIPPSRHVFIAPSPHALLWTLLGLKAPPGFVARYLFFESPMGKLHIGLKTEFKSKQWKIPKRLKSLEFCWSLGRGWQLAPLFEFDP